MRARRSAASPVVTLGTIRTIRTVGSPDRDDLVVPAEWETKLAHAIREQIDELRLRALLGQIDGAADRFHVVASNRATRT